MLRRTGENDWNTPRVDAYFLKNIRMCGRTGPNTYLPPINCSQVFLTVEHAAVVGAEILKEKETTSSTNMTKKHKKDS